ncbi:hypothetical protein H257_15209 [Aphanomyces astaci]|uniref:Uncharacterized protein n=1 Tax=Aphanomyces astaci TaxID=112090 RepID=W4FNM7_APHAT|nr:hypothetical protein H257_15209 [Aphanomyces astaci]ETV69072.1 hypothetical protein H257_15209 [Aphanomyces astaci]|eukprot:XP_009841531.1 hypothetical protein H257_15209 [Aphanomyces astaci]
MPWLTASSWPPSRALVLVRRTFPMRSWRNTTRSEHPLV